MSGFKKYHCLECEHIYDEAKGDPDSGIPPGTRWMDIPVDWSCPICGAPKSFFKLTENLEFAIDANQITKAIVFALSANGSNLDNRWRMF